MEIYWNVLYRLQIRGGPGNNVKMTQRKTKLPPGPRCFIPLLFPVGAKHSLFWLRADDKHKSNRTATSVIIIIASFFFERAERLTGRAESRIGLKKPGRSLV